MPSHEDLGRTEERERGMSGSLAANVARSTSQTSERLTSLATIGGVGFVVGILALHVLDRMDPIREIISAYGAGPYWYLLTGAFVAWSIGYVSLAIALRAAVAPARGLSAAIVLLFVAAGAMFVNSIIPCDPGCGNTTALGTLHSVLSFPFFLGTIAAMLLLLVPFRNDPSWRPIYRISLVLCVYAVVTTVALFAVRASGLPFFGLAQRLIVIGLVGWYLITVRQLRKIVEPLRNS
jgi:hypothetical protein